MGLAHDGMHEMSGCMHHLCHSAYEFTPSAIYWPLIKGVTTC